MSTLIPGFFDWLLRCTFQASVLILLALVAVAVVRRRVPARWQCLLWAVVLARLLLPWVPQSRFSVFNWIPSVAAPSAAGWSGGWPSGESLLPLEGEAGVRVADQDAATSLVPSAAEAAPWAAQDVIRLGWLSVAVGLSVLIVLGTFRLWRGVGVARPVLDEGTLGLLARCSADVGLAGPPGLVESRLVRTPCLFGFFRPLMLLPEGLISALPPERLRHVFLHELAHMKRHDVEAGWLLAIIQVLHWFNPLVWIACRRFRSDRELACDALALSHLPSEERKAYAETLIQLVQGASRAALMPSLAGIFEGPSDLKRRITMISKFETLTNRGWLAGAILIAALACAGLTDARSAAAGERPAVIADSPDSQVDASGRIVDKIDYPFVNDPAAIGQWESVDFVREIKDFDPAARKFKEDLFLKEMILLNRGRTARPWYTWTKGLICHKGDQTASKYVIRKIGGTTYMFFEWKSGDYAIRHQKPGYYVLKKVSSDVKAFEGNWSKLPSDAEFARTLQAKVDKLDISKATLDDVTKLFGEPGRYYYSTKGDDPSGIVTTDRDHLPAAYVMEYPADFYIFMAGGQIGEIRFHRPGYKFEGKLEVGDSVEQAMKVVGPPKQTTSSKKIGFTDGVLFMDVDGKKGDGYYASSERHVRMFFRGGKISAMYLTRPDGPFEREGRVRTGRASNSEFSRQLQAKVDKLDLKTAKREDVVKVFGQPTQYIWGNEVFKADSLPERYIMDYPDGFTVFISGNQIVELRFHEPNYAFEGRLKVGSSTMEDAFKVIGQPDKTVKGGKCLFENGVYYQNSSAEEGGESKGVTYYARKERNVRMFASDGKIIAIYVTRPQ